MSGADEDLQAFAQRYLRSRVGGRALELEPWQLAVLGTLQDPDARLAWTPAPGQRWLRRMFVDVAAAHAIARGETVRFVGADPAEAEAARQRALGVLDALDRLEASGT